MSVQEPFAVRFAGKVHKTDSCWEWTGYKNAKGYGVLANVNGKNCQAHRASWLIHFGDFDQSLMVLHKCDNPPCVNPDHLFLGTALDNVIDAIVKRRFRRHVRQTPESIKMIRHLYFAERARKQDLAEFFNTTASNIGHIVSGRNWSQIHMESIS